MGNDRVIPNAVILPADPTGQATPSVVNATVASATKVQVIWASADSVIPVLYGGPERMAGMGYVARIYQGKLLLCLILCEGPVESITKLEINDEAAPASVAWTAYLGTATQNVDPWLAAAIPGFAETMRGTAYIVVKIPPGVNQGFSRTTVEVKGLKVYDPRLTFKAVKSDLATSWVDFGTPPAYVPNACVARDGTLTAHSLVDQDADPATSGGRKFTWTVPNDSLARTISISINKDLTASHQAGVGVAYTGGGTPRSYVVQVNLVTGVTTPYSGSGGTARVVDHPNHWEVLLSLTNNGTGNTSFVLSLYPAL